MKEEKKTEYELQCDIDWEIVLGKQASEELMQYLWDFTIDAYITVLNSWMRLLEIKNKKKIKLLENGEYELCVRKKRKFRFFNLFN